MACPGSPAARQQEWNRNGSVWKRLAATFHSALPRGTVGDPGPRAQRSDPGVRGRPPPGVWGPACPGLSPSPRRATGSSRPPWLVAASPRSLPASSRGLLPVRLRSALSLLCLCPTLPCLMRTPGTGVGLTASGRTPRQVGLRLNTIPSERLHIQIRSHSQVPRLELGHVWGDTIPPGTSPYIKRE